MIVFGLLVFDWIWYFFIEKGEECVNNRTTITDPATG